ncbi:peptide ABC transporter substrate-binding protein, partial [Cetobacterium somerae]|nr:peptide ABC transporter substrate-binding protein [Cetobacterium somerae]
MFGRLNGKSLAIESAVLFLVACGGKDEEKKAQTSVESKKNSIYYNLGTDQRTIDPQLNTAVDGSIVASNIFEG